jgi:hypothetical protein
LRTALDGSREELERLKEQSQSQPESSPEAVVERLVLENHLLRRRLLGRAGEFSSDAATSPAPTTRTTTSPSQPRPEAEGLEVEKG